MSSVGLLYLLDVSLHRPTKAKTFLWSRCQEIEEGHLQVLHERKKGCTFPLLILLPYNTKIGSVRR